MRGDEDGVGLRLRAVARGDLEERVHDRVSGQMDPIVRHVLGLQGRGRAPRGREIDVGDEVDDAPIHLLREGVLEVPVRSPAST